MVAVTFEKFRFIHLIIFFLLSQHCVIFCQTTGLNKRVTPDTATINYLNDRADFFLILDSDSALYYSETANKLAKTVKYTLGEAKSLVNMAVFYQTKGNFSLATETNLDVIDLLEKQNTGLKGAAYLGLSRTYKDMSADNNEDYINQGLSYSRTAYEIYYNLKDSVGMANSLSMSGILFRDKSKLENQGAYYDSAFIEFTKAIKLVTNKEKEGKILSKLYNNISQVYTEYKKDYKKGLEYLFMAVAINEQLNSLLGLTHNYGNISQVYIQLKNYNKALEYARKMLEASEKIKRPSRVYFSYLQLYSTFKAAGIFDSALQYHILATTLNDSLTNINRTGQVMELQVKYETAKKELEIQKLNQDNSSKNLRIILLITALVTMAGVALGFIFLYRRVQHQKAELQDKSKRLELLMKELHHRVKNNLQIVSSLLSLQTYKSADEHVITVLKESQQRVQAMSLIHQRLYTKDEFTSINIREYVSDLINSLMSSFGYNKSNFNVKLNISKEMLDIDQALPLGLILNEMVTNSFKYAYIGIDFPSLYVSLSEDAISIFLSVKDNGIGLDESEWKHKKGSFGKQLVTALGKQLRAKQSIHVNNGTEFNLIIPKKVA